MVLHRPIELALLIGMWLCAGGTRWPLSDNSVSRAVSGLEIEKSVLNSKAQVSVLLNERDRLPSGDSFSEGSRFARASRLYFGKTN